MKITTRIPSVQFGFEELEFDNVEEYREQYPKYVKAYIEVKAEVEKIKKLI